MFSTIIKRDGRTAAYDVEKIAKAIFQAATSVGGRDFETAHALALQVQQRLEETYPSSQSPTVQPVVFSPLSAHIACSSGERGFSRRAFHCSP